jgi:phosphonate transport system substrate-binding protein
MTATAMLLRVLLLLCLIAPLSANAQTSRQTFTLSVVPQFTPVDIGLRWTPLLRHLEAETGYSFQLRLLDKIPRFETDFLSGIPDLVYLNPFHMLMAADAQGYIPLVRGSDPLIGILVAEKNSAVKTLQDLNGKRLAFPAPNAFGASLYMRALLTEKEGLRFSSDYVGSHQNVYRHVLIGDAAAGGGIHATLEKESVAIRNRLRVLYTTPGVPPHPFAAHPRVTQTAREKIRAAMLKLDSTPSGRKLLADVELDKVISADLARDYLPLAKLKINQNTVSK